MALEHNQLEYAQYNTEMLVKEYGTHYLNRVKIGGIYFHDYFLSQSYYRQHKSEYELIKTTTKKKSFLSSSSSSSTSEYFTQEENQVLSQIKSTRTETIGGKYLPDMKLEDWSKTLDNNLVVIDKEVALISDTILRSNFPFINNTILEKIRGMIGTVNQNYVRANLRLGCTDRSSIMFDKTANYDPNDNECAEKYFFFKL
jgi:hypothetical protein